MKAFNPGDRILSSRYPEEEGIILELEEYCFVLWENGRTSNFDSGFLKDCSRSDRENSKLFEIAAPLLEAIARHRDRFPDPIEGVASSAGWSSLGGLDSLLNEACEKLRS